MKFSKKSLILSAVLSITLSSIPSFAASSIFNDAFPDQTEGSGGQPLLATAEVIAGGVSGLSAVVDYRSDKFYDLSNRRQAELDSLVKLEAQARMKLDGEGMKAAIIKRNALVSEIAKYKSFTVEAFNRPENKERFLKAELELSQLDSSKSGQAFLSRFEKEKAAVLANQDLSNPMINKIHSLEDEIKKIRLMKIAKTAGAIVLLGDAAARIGAISHDKAPGYLPSITLSRSAIKGLVGSGSSSEGNQGASTSMDSE